MNIENAYSQEDIEEFRKVIVAKIALAKEELNHTEESLKVISSNIAQDKINEVEDSFVVEEQEMLNSLSIRLKKFIQHLEAAMVRINKGTYGICRVTGKRIDKRRLLLVPHTTHSVEAKNNRKT